METPNKINIKDVIINKISEPKHKSVLYDGEIVKVEAFNVKVIEGETMASFFQRVRDNVKRGYLSKEDIYELISQIKLLLHTNKTPDNAQHAMFEKRFDNLSSRINEIRGKQPRKDKDRLKDICNQMIFVCDDLIDGVENYID
ncbi:hypothetical protein [Fulvivirga sp.]|uniref:hypothetical protein n=1 Tax=Fulvivirga sp. TaxID=1931237 RepID=UPI0032EE0B82